MNMDCQWVEDHLEAIFCDTLGEDQTRQVRAHIESCIKCRNEVQALLAIDPVIKKYFRTQLTKAVRAGDAPARGVRKLRWAVPAAAIALVAVVLVAFVRSPQTNTVESRVPVQTAVSPTVPADIPPANKDDELASNDRAKPSPDQTIPRNAPGRSPVLPGTPGANAPDFLISDPAGYSHSSKDYRGFKTLIGVWAPDKPQSIATLERLYKTFGPDPT